LTLALTCYLDLYSGRIKRVCYFPVLRFDSLQVIAMLDSLKPFLDSINFDAAVDTAAISDNCLYDERATDLRWQAFVNYLPHNDLTKLSLADWSEANQLHADNRVRVLSTSIPDAFLEINQPAWLHDLEPRQEVIRLEALEWPLASIWNTDLRALQLLVTNAATQPEARSAVKQYFDNWNLKRDNRPAYAAFFDEVREEAEHTDWPHQLRDRLGLSHYSPEHGTRIPVALMRYPLEYVFQSKKACHGQAVCALPSVLDGGMHPYFFPVPQEHSYGSTLHLADGQADLLTAEILHHRIDYQPDHLWKLGWIERPHAFQATTDDRDSRLRSARDLHLIELRIHSKRDDFGKELVGRS
jgi:hypothetical protein